MNTDRELMQQALEKLEFFAHMKSVSEDTRRLITDLRERLAQPKQKPFCYHDGRNIVGKEYAHHCDVFPLYTEQQPAQQPLTDDRVWLEYMQLWPFRLNDEPTLAKDILRFARAIEAAHGITGEKK
jgi:hypothetical protein